MDVRALIEEMGLTQISDEAELGRVVADILATQPEALADFRAGRTQAVEFLMGKAIQATNGRANPGLTRKLLLERLEDE